MVATDPTAFDAFAEAYDDDFTRSLLARLLRPRVWQRLAQHFSPGQHVLELACGTGEDAVWLARRGIRVTATDGSAQMVAAATAKARAAGVSDRVEIVQYSLQEITNYPKGASLPTANRQFDGAFSNFGGLNTINAWRALAESLSKLVKPGGKLILAPMGPFCPWEMLWHLAHGQPGVALRRFGRSATAKIGESEIPIWYPSARRLRADFAPWFKPVGVESLGLWLPPSYLGHLVERWPGLFTRLNRLEAATARLTGGWGDHYLIIFERAQP